MYFFFALSGVLDLLTMKGLAPEGTDYLGMVIALLVEGALFKFHLFGRDELDVLIHVLLLYAIGFSALVVALEAAFRSVSRPVYEFVLLSLGLGKRSTFVHLFLGRIICVSRHCLRQDTSRSQCWSSIQSMLTSGVSVCVCDFFHIFTVATVYVCVCARARAPKCATALVKR